MHHVKLWQMVGPNSDTPAIPVNVIDSADAENFLEETIASMPSLLEPHLTIVGRQLPTTNGPLDLLGVDQDGRLVIYELKRGALARDAVAQIVDYASDLDSMDRHELAQHIESRSGNNGVDRIEDFLSWHDDQFPGASDVLNKTPRMVLVGISADSRVRRMVNFLASLGVEIDVLTFQAFRLDDKTLLARHVEVVGNEVKKAKQISTGWTKPEVEAALAKNCETLGVSELLPEMRHFIAEQLNGSHPGTAGKNGVTFYLSEWPDNQEGKHHAYFSLKLDTAQPRKVRLAIIYRAFREGGEVAQKFINKYLAIEESHSNKGWTEYVLFVGVDEWKNIQADLKELIDAVKVGIEQAELDSATPASPQE